MIKASTVHQGNAHVLVLVDGRIQYHACPVEWFNRSHTGEVSLAWPPPLEQSSKPSKTNDAAKGAEALRVTKS